MIGKSKILLVDDIEENLVALEALLRRDDAEILFAHSGVEALEMVLAHEFALAFIDVQMPEMDGFELAELMRGSERSKYIPIIFVTAGTGDATRVFRGYESGAVDFLLKPLDPHAVRHKAETFIALDQQRKKLSAQYQLLQQSEALMREAVQAREDVLAVVSHDVRNFLQAIKSGVQLLTRRPDKLNDEMKSQIHARLSSTVDLMSRVIADLLDMANIRNGTIAVAPRPELIGNILNEAAAVHEPLADGKGIQLSVQCEFPDDVVECDRQRVLQVLANLLGNAIKFCRQGDTISIAAERRDALMQVSVRDSGPGIAAVDIPLVFEPYWSGSGGEGTGLGLYITKRIVEAHQGEIWIDSKPGQGTNVHFTLKRAPQAS
jgi:two-component system, sensor histidine kinase and response regulator